MILGTIPCVGAGLPIGEATWFGHAAMALMGGGLHVAQHVVGKVLSRRTAPLIFGYMAEGDGCTGAAWSKVTHVFREIASLAAASTRNRPLGGGLRRCTRQRNTTAHRTCRLLGPCDAEGAQVAGQSIEAAAPPPLAQSLAEG
jgi:hypothetical protein